MVENTPCSKPETRAPSQEFYQRVNLPKKIAYFLYHGLVSSTRNTYDSHTRSYMEACRMSGVPVRKAMEVPGLKTMGRAMAMDGLRAMAMEMPSLKAMGVPSMRAIEVPGLKAMEVAMAMPGLRAIATGMPGLKAMEVAMGMPGLRAIEVPGLKAMGVAIAM